MQRWQKQREAFKSRDGFIAALDQSGGSTPKALGAYGIGESAWKNDEEMYGLVHQMRTRIMTSSAFDSRRILAAILFENTMDREVEGQATPDYLWETKKVVPILKVDKGLDTENNGVKLMKPIAGLGELLDRAVSKNVFGTKMRSVVMRADPGGIDSIVAQQYEVAEVILARGLVPIIEPEVDIHCPEKEKAEDLLKASLLKHLPGVREGKEVIFKLTIPSKTNFYTDLINHPKTLKVVALSGGYSREDACRRLAEQNGMIASFSRALSEGLFAEQSQQHFDETLGATIQTIFEASKT